MQRYNICKIYTYSIEQNVDSACLLYVFFIVLDIRLIKGDVPACDK